VSGDIFAYSAQTGATTIIPKKLAARANCYMAQADRYFVLQDGVSETVILTRDDSGIKVFEPTRGKNVRGEFYDAEFTGDTLTLEHTPLEEDEDVVVIVNSVELEEDLEYTRDGAEITFPINLETAGRIVVEAQEDTEFVGSDMSLDHDIAYGSGPEVWVNGIKLEEEAYTYAGDQVSLAAPVTTPSAVVVVYAWFDPTVVPAKVRVQYWYYDADYVRVPNIPQGFSMAYAHGRLHVVPTVVPNTDTDGRAYLVSGDICDPLDPSTVLSFTETEYLSEGGANGLPAELGLIGGLGSLRSSETGTGVGSTIAFGRNGVCAFDFSISRARWKSQALSQVLFMNGGCRSPRSVTSANNDLLYRSDDGLRSIGYSINQNGGSLMCTPVSMELLDYLRVGNTDAATTFAAFCDNRLVTSTEHVAQTFRRNGYFKGLVSWDLAAGYYLGMTAGAAYDGVWTGARFGQAVTVRVDGAPRMFVFGKDNAIYVVNDQARKDAGTTKIESRLDTRTYFFGNRVSRKRLQYVELFLADLVHDVSVSVWYRPHGYAKWFPLGSRDIVVPDTSLPQCRANVRISVDTNEDVCHAIDGVPPYSAVGFQFAIAWTGYAVLEGFKAEALVPPAEAPPEPCSETEGVVLLPGSGPSGEILEDFGYTWEA